MLALRWAIAAHWAACYIYIVCCCFFSYKWHIPFTYTSSSEKQFNKDEKSIIMMDLRDSRGKIIFMYTFDSQWSEDMNRYKDR